MSVSARSPAFWLHMLFFPLTALYCEVLLHGLLFSAPPEGAALTLTLPIGLLVGALVLLLPRKAARLCAPVLSFLLVLPFCAQLVYYRIFGAFLVVQSALSGGVGQAWDNRDVALAAIRSNWHWLALLLLPFFLTLLPRKGDRPPPRWLGGVAGAAAAVLYTLAVWGLPLWGAGAYDPAQLYRKPLAADLCVQRLGVLPTLGLDLKYLVFGPPEAVLTPPVATPEVVRPVPTPPLAAEPAAPVVDRSPNALDIDFGALAQQAPNKTVREMHEYFAQVEPTAKNEYTGLFEGYNVIFVCAEGFSPLAVSPELTPTLYQMIHGGFSFNNFYNPVWGVSTSDGEYVNLTGLLPKSGVWSFKTSGVNQNALPFTLGRQFQALGYTTIGYHNHSYTYYSRDISHPNLGYDWRAPKHGLEITKVWPESDLEMMENSVDQWIDQEPFHLYYLTVSGHLEYNFPGNTMASRHKAEVAHLPYSDMGRAYIACNLELERAMAYLVERLEQADLADKTLIVLSADHYPYGLIKDGDYSVFSELLGHEVERNFELYKNHLIIWSASMTEPVPVDAYCSTLDVLPTVSNLLGLPYDSRLLMGTDVFSGTPPLVIFNSRDWISQDCMYDCSADQFVSLSDTVITDEYLEAVNRQVNNKFTLSANILTEDYYRYVLPAPAKP